MQVLAVMMLLVAAALAANHDHAGHDHGAGHEKEECSCAQFEPDHPFTIDCDKPQPIRDATVKLETTCEEAQSYEWGGVFGTPGTAYKWVAQAVGGAYADPSMKLVVFATDKADAEHLLENGETAATLMAGTCTVVNTGDTIPTPTAAGACYTLTFPSNAATDFHATLSTAGVANVAFFGEHVPTEFERDTHYFMSTDLTLDIEPVKETDAKEYNCKFGKNTAGIKECAQAFYIIQAHHDYCPHDTLTRYEEELFHKWESKCFGCKIVRKYNPLLKKCPTVDCSDTTVAELGYEHLHGSCVKADTSYPFEWEATIATPANEYTWVSQAASANASLASGYYYADETMKLVAIAMSGPEKSKLFAMKDTADTLMSGSCPEVTATCTPGAPACATAPTITPTTAGVCYTIKFPDSSAALVDFHAKFNTAGLDYVAIFTAHGPTEFERDMHYFMSTDLQTDIEPATTLGEAAAHDHGRRLSSITKPMNDRRSKRRLADPGSCCNTDQQKGAWKQVVAYHDLCDYDEVPPYIEIGFHDYEASCENFFCNLIDAGVDQTVCPYAPPSPPAFPLPVIIQEKDTGIEESTLIGICVGAGVAVLLVITGICVLIGYEKQGKPLFTELNSPRPGTNTGKKESPAV